MSARLIDALMRLAPRERLLLALLAGVVVPLALVAGLLWPLAGARQDAARTLAEAEALHRWVAARAGEAAALAPAQEQAPRGAIGMAGLEQSLIEARLRPYVRDLADGAEGAVELRLEAIPFTDLARWLGGSDPGWGYAIAAMRITRTQAPGLVAASLRLVPRAAPGAAP